MPEHLSTTKLPDVPDLELELGRLLRQIPADKVTTYGQLAKALGSITAAKWVSTALLSPEKPSDWPVERVVRVDGSLGDYPSRPAADQARLLAAAGFEVQAGRVDLSRHGFNEFHTNFPLQRLVEWQQELASQVRLSVAAQIAAGIQVVGAVDVSYRNSKTAVAGYALTDLQSGALIWSRTREQPLKFPYISGFLGFRELPALVPLIQEVHQAGQLADVLIVDGNGTLHVRGAGVASHLGVVTGLPTIGVSKTLSFGQVELENMQPKETRPIVWKDQIIGMAVRPAIGSKPLFVSPGHQIDLTTATQIVLASLHQHRLPEPQFWADHLSRQASKRDPETPALGS